MKFEDKEFEKNFQIEHAKKASKNFQFSIFLGFLTIILYAFVDLWSLPITYEFAHKLRFFITGPALLGLVAFSFTKSFYKYIDLSIILAGFITALSIALMIAHAKHNETGYDQYYAGMLLVNVWVATYVRSKFMPALITVILNNITYIFVALFIQDYMSSSDPTRIHVFYSNLCFILSTNVVSLLGCRDMEIYARNEFLQNAMIQADQVRLVDASRLAAVGEMAAGIAHEINNPLSIILTGTQSLEKKIKLNSLTSDQLSSTLIKISHSGNRIMKIIKSLKTFSRDGSLDDFQIESLHTLITESVYFCQEKFTHSGVKLIINEIPDVFIKCKPTQISQVLVNLLNNSFDAIQNLETPVVEILFKVESDKLYLSVRDSGPGISKEIAEKIMIPFFTTKPVGKGTGLGLSLSKEIIEQHDGEFYLETKTHNTTFTLMLPLISRKV